MEFRLISTVRMDPQRSEGGGPAMIVTGFPVTLNIAAEDCHVGPPPRSNIKSRARPSKVDELRDLNRALGVCPAERSIDRLRDLKLGRKSHLVEH